MTIERFLLKYYIIIVFGILLDAYHFSACTAHDKPVSKNIFMGYKSRRMTEYINII